MTISKIIQSLSKPLEFTPTNVKPKLKKINGIRAAIFDIYGTLLISNTTKEQSVKQEANQEEILRDALAYANFEILEPQVSLSEVYEQYVDGHYGIRRAEGIEYPEINIGDVWQDFLNELFTQGVIDGDLTEKTIRRAILYYECQVNPVWPRAGTLEFLRTLQDKDIYSGAISTAQFYTPLALETLYQNSLETLGFKRSLCIWSFEHKQLKPSSALFKLCTERLHELGIEPDETLYVGNDMRCDIIPAHQAGFKTALFAGDAKSYNSSSSAEEINACKPTVVFTKFDQLKNYIF